MDFELLISMLAATLRLTTPLLLACLAGLYSERSGIFDIGLEGKMLAAAFGAASVAALTANMWLGLLAGWAVGMGVGTWMAWSLNFKSSIYAVQVFGFTLPCYAAVSALVLNLGIAFVISLALKSAPRPDETAAGDYV